MVGSGKRFTAERTECTKMNTHGYFKTHTVQYSNFRRFVTRTFFRYSKHNFYKKTFRKLEISYLESFVSRGSTVLPRAL